MRPVDLVSVLLAVTCCSSVCCVEIYIRQKPGNDVLKFNLPSKAKMSGLAKRRSRRAAVEGDPNSVDAKQEKGSCMNPADEEGHEIHKRFWNFVNETKLSISMAWIGKRNTGEARALLLLATTELLFISRQSVLYKSENFGASFSRINVEVFDTHIRKDGGIMKSPVNPNKVILVSYSNPFSPMTHSGIVRTDDGGQSWTKHELPFQVTGPLLFHPYQEDWILARGVMNGQAYLSTDFGKKWIFLQSYVRSVKWGARTDKKGDKEEKTILMTVAAGVHSFMGNDAVLLRSRDLGKHFESIHVQHVYTFGLQGPFLYVSIDYDKNNKTRVMHVSKNGGDTWDPVQVPTVTPERFYSILDMSEGMIFLHVDESGDTGKGILYTSDADGIVFSESLRNHVYTNFGEINDFYRVESMRGTYLTSRMNPDNSVTSLISHDRGGEWKPIPLTDEQCKEFNDKDVPDEKCSLQIHNRFSASKLVDFPMGPLSVPNAVGIIIAHGHVGSSLTRRADVWMSNNGGYGWFKVLDGSHLYSIGDHGNLIVAVPTSTPTTRYLMFSVNEGHCWFKYEFTTHDFHVAGLVTEPGAKTMVFNLWGFTMPSREWQVFTVDFKRVLQRPCKDDDYEDWVPHGEGGNDGCLLGKKVTIKKLKKEVLCFNGVGYALQESCTCCKCTPADLECDYGYFRDQDDKCVLSKNREPELCLHGDVDKLKDSLGHRLVPGDTCCGGSKDVRQYLDTHQRCKSISWYDYGMDYNYQSRDGNGSKDGHSANHTAVLVVIPLLLIVIFAAAYFGRKYWQLEKFRPSYRYSQLSQDEEEDMEGSETFKYNPRPKGLREYRDYDTDDEDATMIDL